MNLSQTTQVFGNTDLTWLGSARGTTSGRPCSFKVSTLTAGTHYPNGFLRDGLTIALPTSGANVGYAVPLVSKVTEVQAITITGGPTGGTIALTLDGETASGIAYNATAAAVQTALEGLSNVNPGDVAVSGGPGPATPWAVTFGPATKWAGKDVPQMTAASSLTGGTSPAVAVTTTTPGGSGVTDGSDIWAGVLYMPVAVPAGATVVNGTFLDTGRVINSRLPFPLSAAQIATNPQFVVL
jgi:hypothetical protein